MPDSLTGGAAPSDIIAFTDSSSRSKWDRWRPLASIVIWPALGLVFAGQLYLFYSHTAQRIAWSQAMAWEITHWCAWIPLAPLVLLLARKFTLDRRRRIPRLAIHAAASIVLALVHVAIWVGALLLTYSWLGGEFGKHSIRRFVQLGFTLDFHISILVYWAIFTVHQALYSSRRAASLETQLARAELQALKMQLHPHFLFNSLNSISALLHKDPEAADEMVGALGDFLRLTLENPGSELVTLREELKFVEYYLEIERVRFQSRLQTRFEIDESTLDAAVPNLLLQPIIENAVKHAIAPRAAPGNIEIRAARRDGTLRIEVSDDGPGAPADERGVVRVAEGIGLANTRERLRQAYGSSHRLVLSNGPSGGLTVLLEIPFRTRSGA